MRRDWTVACLAMGGILAALALIITLSPGPVEAHIVGLVPPAPPSGGTLKVQPIETGTRFELVPSAAAYVGMVRIEIGGAVGAIAPLKGKLTRVVAKSVHQVEGPALKDGETIIAVFCPKSMAIERVVDATRAAVERGEDALELPCAQERWPKSE